MKKANNAGETRMNRMHNSNMMNRRILLLLRLFYEQTDEEHQTDTHKILDYLEEKGIHADRKTIAGDIKLLIDNGFDIIRIESRPNKYYWGARTFELPELKMLVDAVSSSRFITAKKSKALTKKIISLAGTADRSELNRHIYATNRIKATNESILYVVDTVNDAIRRRKQLCFQYYDYSPKKERILRNNGELYMLSPYALFWNEDYYYMVGWSEKHNNISTFRVDRIVAPEIMDIKAVKRPDDFDLEDYSRKIFEMFDGDRTVVKLKCKNDLMKYVIDRFGEDVETEIINDEYFKVTTEVSLSPTFYAWVFQFEGGIRILSPTCALNKLLAMTTKLTTAQSL